MAKKETRGKVATAVVAPPTPVLTQGRSCFGIAWFATEEEANRYDAFVVARGDRYNGGFFDGAPCGREAAFDFFDPTLGKIFAVTTR